MVALAALPGILRVPIDQVIGWLYGSLLQTFLPEEHRARLDLVHAATIDASTAAPKKGGGPSVGGGSPPTPAAAFGRIDYSTGEVRPLSQVHIVPQSPIGCVSKLYEGGRLGKVKMNFESSGEGVGGPRGAIQKFSDSSRRRLRDLVASIDRRAMEGRSKFFVTLTYPDSYASARDSKRHLKAFFARFERAWGHHPILWKLEPQRRGAPHYHLILFAMSSIDLGELLAWTARTWAEIVGAAGEKDGIPRDPWHLLWHLGQAGRGNTPCVQMIRTWDGVSSYAAKYLGKPIDGDNEGAWDIPGRFWGVHRRNVLQEHLISLREETMDVKVGYKLKRLCRKYVEKQSTGRYRIEAENGQVNRSKLKPGEADNFRKLGFKVTPICHKLRRGPGGCTVYMSSDGFARLINWAVAQVPIAEQIREVIPI